MKILKNYHLQKAKAMKLMMIGILLLKNKIKYKFHKHFKLIN